MSNASEILKRAIKASFRVAGLDVQRHRRRPDPLELLSQIGVRTVLDVGANRGQFVQLVRPLLPAATIHAFEPVPNMHAQLVDRAARDHLLIAHECALGDTDGSATLNVNDFVAASSLLATTDMAAQAFPKIQHARQISVKVRRLDTWAAETALSRPFFVKLDVQGYEDRVIRGGSATLAHAVGILTEVSFLRLYEGQVLFDELHDMIRALGLSCAGMFGCEFDPTTGRPLYADALYLRDDAIRSS